MPRQATRRVGKSQQLAVFVDVDHPRVGKRKVDNPKDIGECKQNEMVHIRREPGQVHFKLGGCGIQKNHHDGRPHDIEEHAHQEERVADQQRRLKLSEAGHKQLPVEVEQSGDHAIMQKLGYESVEIPFQSLLVIGITGDSFSGWHKS